MRAVAIIIKIAQPIPREARGSPRNDNIIIVPSEPNEDYEAFDHCLGQIFYL